MRYDHGWLQFVSGDGGHPSGRSRQQVVPQVQSPADQAQPSLQRLHHQEPGPTKGVRITMQVWINPYVGRWSLLPSHTRCCRAFSICCQPLKHEATAAWWFPVRPVCRVKDQQLCRTYVFNRSEILPARIGTTGDNTLTPFDRAA